MNKVYNQIKEGFSTLSSADKVELLVELYYSLYDGEKDDFLRETENA